MRGSFPSLIGSQIAFLVSNLSKKNYKANVAELHNLIDLYGDDANIILLRALVQSIELPADGKSSNQKDNFRVQLLNQEISSLSSKEYFITVLCQSFGTLKKCDEATLSSLSNVLKLSLTHELLLGTALCCASSSEVQAEAAKFLKGRLAQLRQAGPSILSERVAHHLIYCVRTIDELEPCREDVLNILVPHFEPNAPQDPLFNNCKDKGLIMSKEDTSSGVIADVAKSTSLGRTMLDIGYSITATMEECTAFLETFPDFTEEDIAVALGVIVRSYQGLSSDWTFLSTPFDRPPPADLDKVTTWNVEIFVDAVSNLRPSLKWPDVFQHLDHSGFIVPDPTGFHLLMSAFRRATEVPFPIGILFGRWNNTAGQVSFLQHAILAPPDVFTFAASPRRQEPFDLTGKAGNKGSPNFAWNSLDLIETLLELSESQHYTSIRSLFEAPIKQCPELLLLGLAQTKPRNMMQQELVATIVPNFLAGHPASSAMLHRLWAMRPDMVTTGMAKWYERDSSNLSRILEVTQDLKALGSMLEAKPFSFVIDLAALASRREYLNLEKWLTEQIAKNQVAFVSACMQYLNDKALVKLEGSGKGGHLILDIIAVFFKCLQSVSNTLPPNMADSLKQLYSSCVHVNPKLVDYNSENQVVFAADIENEANSYFQRIYTNQLSIEEVVELLKKFKSSPNQREQDIFACMIHNLFDEYRFFPKYPDKELVTTGVLFGSLIHHQLVSYIPLGIALRYVLDALRKPHGSKMFKFGLFALKQFKARLFEWPQYCAHILQIPHIQEHHADVVHYIEQVLADAQAKPEMFPRDAAGDKEATKGNPEGGEEVAHQKGGSNRMAPSVPAGLAAQQGAVAGRGDATGKAPVGAPVAPGGGDQSPPRQGNGGGRGGGDKGGSNGGGGGGNDGTGGGGGNGNGGGGTGAGGDGNRGGGGNGGGGGGGGNNGGGPPRGGGGGNNNNNAPSFPNTLNIDTLIENGNDVPELDEVTRDKIHFIFNNVSLSMMDQKVEELKDFLQAAHYPYLCHYLVVKRASVESNLHNLYLTLLDRLGSKPLLDAVRKTTIEKVKVLLKSNKIKSSSSERSLLKNLGSWLGQLTLARNKPLFHRDLPLKDLVVEAYKEGRLIAVIPFVAKILEACAHSKVFEPPNPWVMAIIRLLAELYNLHNLKLNLKFEIEVLCKRINLDITEVKPTSVLGAIAIDHTTNYDFSHRAAGSSSQVGSGQLGTEDDGSGHQRTEGGSQRSNGSGRRDRPEVMVDPHGSSKAYPSGSQGSRSGDVGTPSGDAGLVPNLSAYIQISRSVLLFQQQPHLKRCVPIAMDRAIREIISPVVERSVTIARISTRELITKDFAMESDEKKMRHAAHLMVQNLAGSLALVTCKEPLRVSMTNHLLNLLQANTTDAQQRLVEEAVQVVAMDNLELACVLIEKAATEKAVREIDDALANAFSLRRKHRERTGHPYYDVSIFTTTERYPSSLPEALRPVPGGLQPKQQRVYEDFARVRPTTFERADAIPHNEGKKRPEEGEKSSLEVFQGVVVALEKAILSAARAAAAKKGTMVEPVPLDSDHDVHVLLSKVPALLSQVNVLDVAGGIAQNLLLRLRDSDAALFIDAHIAILKMVRDACKGKLDFVKELTTMLIYSEEERRLHPMVTVHLIQARLVALPQIDMHLATMMEAGRYHGPDAAGRHNQAADAAVHIIRQCVVDNQLAPKAAFKVTLEALGKVAAQARGGKRAESVARLMEDLAAIDDNKGGPPSSTGSAPVPAAPGSGRRPGSGRVDLPRVAAKSMRPEALTDPPGLRDQVLALFQEWQQVTASQPPSDKIHASFITRMQQRAFLKGDDTTWRMFRILVEIAVDATNEAAQAEDRNVTVDSLARLIFLIVKAYGNPPPSQTGQPAAASAASAASAQKMSLVNKVFGVISSVLRSDAERTSEFNQRPFFRLFAVLMIDLNAPNPQLEPIAFQILQALSATFHDLRPARVPSFAFAWLELVSHRTFMPKLLLAKPQKGWMLFQRLLADLFTFLEPFLRTADLNEPIQLLYKGTLRVLLVLLHDFPEFLCDYHFSFCDIIPPSCIQMRNLILSAFPRNMRLPDPFTPNLKVDLLPEINQSPRILSPYKAALEAKSLKADVDTYFKSRGPPNFLNDLPHALLLPPQQAKVRGTRYNVPLVNSLVLYVGVLAVAQMQSSKVITPIPHSAPMDIFQKLVMDLDTEGRYLVFNAIANQLRYPNNHTHYFSCVLLYLFGRKENQEIIQEQITRVLLERLIVNRPHPWGLLITFIELIKNPQYNFWGHSFTRCAPEIERLFESVARSCMGHVAKTEEGTE